jgi:hypothetical protein
MTDLERLKQLFNEIGVVHYSTEGGFEFSKKEIGEHDMILTVSQAHLAFKDGKYLGVLADEMGDFTPRKEAQ